MLPLLQNNRPLQFSMSARQRAVSTPKSIVGFEPPLNALQSAASTLPQTGAPQLPR
jgi:hypothetical protein